MSLETHIAASEDRLIDSLHFAGRNTASYIVARRASTFHPSSAAAWNAKGLIRFNLADAGGWLDAGTLRLIFTISNSTTTALNPLCPSPNTLIRRLRIIANGSAVVEDISDYNRVYQMFTELVPPQRRFTNLLENWGGPSSAASGGTMGLPDADDPIPQDSSRQVCVQLMSSLLSQGKMLPLAHLPLTIELELDDSMAAFTGTTAAEIGWTITRPRLVADVCELDQTLHNSYSSHILSGKSLPFQMHGLYSITASVPSGSSLYSLPIARGFSRLSTIYVTFYDGAAGANTKWVNRFICPNVAGESNTEVTDALSWNVTIGSERWPQFDCTSVQECAYRLRLATTAHLGNDLFSISGSDYRNTKFIIGQSFEKAPGQSSHTGINTRSGSQLSLNFRNLGDTTMVHVVMHYEQILNLSAAGAEMLD